MESNVTSEKSGGARASDSTTGTPTAAGRRVHCASEPPKCGRAPVPAAVGASSKLGRTRTVDAGWASSSRPSKYRCAALPSKTAATAYQRSASSAAALRTVAAGPTTKDNAPSTNVSPRHSPPATLPMAATITSPDCRRALRSQPVIDQGAPEAIGAASSDKGRARPTPPSRKVTLYGPKFAVGANAVGVNAGAPCDIAAQAPAMLIQSAPSAKPR